MLPDKPPEKSEDDQGLDVFTIGELAFLIALFDPYLGNENSIKNNTEVDLDE